MAGDGWKELSTIYPRECGSCGGRVSLKSGALFSAPVKNGKIVGATSTCHLCLKERDTRERCIYCGYVTAKGPTCPHHRDLLAVEAL